MKFYRLIVLLCLIGMLTPVHAQILIDQSRGVDSQVNYQSLTRFGPWDDRNYQLRASDLKLLAKNEADLQVQIPAFFRVELRRELPNLLREGPAQYPRSASQLFQIRYGGLMQNGRIQYEGLGIGYHQPEMVEGNQRSLTAVNAEITLNDVLGANEATIEINPANPSQVIAGANNSGGQEMYYSSDGGASWFISGVLPSTCCDPSLEWSVDGSVAYAAALSSAIGVSFFRSTDAGQTWEDPIDLTANGSDKEFIHVDHFPTSPYRDNLYITYHDGNIMQFARSTDLGMSFGPIQAFSSAPVGIGSDITTDSSGHIYYVYGATSFQQIILLKSTDGGVTFLSPQTIASTNGAFDWPIPAMESRNAWIYAAADTDLSGGSYHDSVYVVWTDVTAAESGIPAENHTQIHVAYSRDGGQTWQRSIPHSTTDVNDVDRFNPWVKVDERGIVHVVFYDTRHSQNRTGVDFYHSYSVNGGQSWSDPERISQQTSDNLNDGQEWGDYNGVAVFQNKLLPIWTDNRNQPQSGNEKNVLVADSDNPTDQSNFVLSLEPNSAYICRSDSLDSLLTVTGIEGFADPVSLSTPDLPAGVTSTITTNPLAPTATTQISWSTDASVNQGSEIWVLEGTDGIELKSVNFYAQIVEAAPSGVMLTTPVDQETDINIRPAFEWQLVSDAESYRFRLDDDADFSSPLLDETVQGLSYTPALPLLYSTNYYWDVTPMNACGAGTAVSAGFTTESDPFVCDVGETAISLFEDDMESGASQWTHSGLLDSWSLSTNESNSPIHSWNATDPSASSDQVLLAQSLQLPVQADGLTLQFWHKQSIESAGTGCYDGAILEISDDGGVSWQAVTQGDLLLGALDGTVNSAYANPLAGLEAWCGDPTDWEPILVDLQNWQGMTIQFRFRLASDGSLGRAEGWSIDDVKIQQCIAGGVFKDGFED